jgi:hypothetical protein
MIIIMTITGRTYLVVSHKKLISLSFMPVISRSAQMNSNNTLNFRLLIITILVDGLVS